MKIRLHLLFSTLIASAMLTGCIYDNAPATRACDAEESLFINLNLSVPLSTRSSGHNYSNQGTPAENYIDIDDIKICIFDSDDNYVDDKYISEVSESTPTDKVNGYYTVTAKLDLSDQEVKNRLSTFKIMVLANWVSFEESNGNTSFNPSFEGYSLSGTKNIFQDGTNFNFTFAPPTASNPYSWTPSIDEKRGIPMFGMSREFELQYAIDMGRYSDDPIDNINMLRAIAKVEIIDELGDRIGSVSMSKANKSGRIIPDIEVNKDWEDPSIQIETPSIPTNPGTIDKIEFVQGPDSDGKRTWVAYIPEMDFTIDERPQFTVYDGEEQLDPKPFNNYENNEVVTDPNKYLPAVLRNHIYSFRVTINDKAGVSINFSVLPWEMEYAEHPWYYDTPQLKPDGEIDWSAATQEGYNVDTDNCRVIMKDGTDGYAEAVFKIASPLHCRWYAQLVPLNGKSDAFEFAEGYDSGIIGEGDGSCTIRIKNTREIVSDYNNEARLVIFVEYPDKTTREVKVTGDGESNYMIVQQINNI